MAKKQLLKIVQVPGNTQGINVDPDGTFGEALGCANLRPEEWSLRAGGREVDQDAKVGDVKEIILIKKKVKGNL